MFLNGYIKQGLTRFTRPAAKKSNISLGYSIIGLFIYDYYLIYVRIVLKKLLYIFLWYNIEYGAPNRPYSAASLQVFEIIEESGRSIDYSVYCVLSKCT